MAITIDGTPVALNAAALHNTLTLTTLLANSVICVTVQTYSGNDPCTVSDSGGANLTWTKQWSWNDGANYAALFTAVAPSPLTADPIVLSTAGGADADMKAWAVHGVNPPVLDGAVVQSATVPFNISTTNPADIIFALFGNHNYNSPPQPVGWTVLDNNQFTYVQYQVVASPQTNLSCAGNGAVPGTNQNFAFALEAASTSNTVTASPETVGSPVFGAPALTALVPLILGSSAIDGGLLGMHNLADKLYICSQPPSDFIGATTTYALGLKNFGVGGVFGAPTAGSPTGRKITSNPVVDGAITISGTVQCWAVVDSVNSNLLATGPLSGGTSVAAGQVWTLGSFAVHLPSS